MGAATIDGVKKKNRLMGRIACKVIDPDGGKSGALQPERQIGGLETEPLVRKMFSNPFLLMASQLGDHQRTTRSKDTRQFRQHGRRLGGMMQHHAENRAIHGPVGDGEVRHFAKPQIDPLETGILHLALGFGKHG